jgi:hypothetical protein
VSERWLIMQQNQMMCLSELIWREFFMQILLVFQSRYIILNQHMTELNGVITKILKG